MAETRYNIDLQENTKSSRINKAALGTICLVVAVWFIYSIAGTRAATATAWVAVIFLFLFALWLILSGFGLTDRYLTIGEDYITLKLNMFTKPRKIVSTSLTRVEFKPLRIDFVMGDRNTTVSLGAYYPDNSAAIMEAVEDFCMKKGIEIRGSGTDENQG